MKLSRTITDLFLCAGRQSGLPFDYLEYINMFSRRNKHGYINIRTNIHIISIFLYVPVQFGLPFDYLEYVNLFTTEHKHAYIYT